MHWPLIACTLLLVLFTRSQGQCFLPDSSKHRQVSHSLEKVLLHQDHHRCSSLDTTYQRLTCEIWDEADESSVRCSARLTEGCKLSSSSCPDGSFSKTCLPHNDGKAYTCACHSLKQPDPCTDNYQWDGEWRNITSGRQGLFRQLCDQKTQQCLAMEWLFNVVHLKKYMLLLDKSISTSKEYDHQSVENTGDPRDNYSDLLCFEMLNSEPYPYTHFDFLEIYLILGVLIRSSCESHQDSPRATKVNIQYSFDDELWKDIKPLDVYPQYGQTMTYPEYVESFTQVFDEAVSGRYWRVVVVQPKNIVAMHADFLGRL